jgi:hypothetical protein
MPKPFKVVSPVTDIVRRTDGRFEKVVAALPAQIMDRRGAAEGVTNAEAMRAEMVPMREVGPGAPKNVGGPSVKTPTPVYPDAIPWPTVGPATDSGKKPYRWTR